MLVDIEHASCCGLSTRTGPPGMRAIFTDGLDDVYTTAAGGALVMHTVAAAAADTGLPPLDDDMGHMTRHARGQLAGGNAGPGLGDIQDDNQGACMPKARPHSSDMPVDNDDGDNADGHHNTAAGEATIRAATSPAATKSRDRSGGHSSSQPAALGAASRASSPNHHGHGHHSKIKPSSPAEQLRSKLQAGRQTSAAASSNMSEADVDVLHPVGSPNGLSSSAEQLAGSGRVSPIAFIKRIGSAATVTGSLTDGLRGTQRGITSAK